MTEALRIAREHTPEAIRGLAELARSSPDDRVRVMAWTKIAEFAGLQHVAALPEGAGPRIDLTHLSPEQRAQIAAAMATIQKILASGPGGTADE